MRLRLVIDQIAGRAYSGNSQQAASWHSSRLSCVYPRHARLRLPRYPGARYAAKRSQDCYADYAVFSGHRGVLSIVSGSEWTASLMTMAVLRMAGWPWSLSNLIGLKSYQIAFSQFREESIIAIIARECIHPPHNLRECQGSAFAFEYMSSGLKLRTAPHDGYRLCRSCHLRVISSKTR